MPRLVRGAGIVVVAVVLFLTMAGALHAGDPGHAGHACSVCDAIVAVGGALLPAHDPGAVLVASAPGRRGGPVADAAEPRFERARIAAPRGPPVGDATPRRTGDARPRPAVS